MLWFSMIWIYVGETMQVLTLILLLVFGLRYARTEQGIWIGFIVLFQMVGITSDYLCWELGRKHIPTYEIMYLYELLHFTIVATMLIYTVEDKLQTFKKILVVLEIISFVYWVSTYQLSVVMPILKAGYTLVSLCCVIVICAVAYRYSKGILIHPKEEPYFWVLLGFSVYAAATSLLIPIHYIAPMELFNTDFVRVLWRIFQGGSHIFRDFCFLYALFLCSKLLSSPKPSGSLSLQSR